MNGIHNSTSIKTVVGDRLRKARKDFDPKLSRDDVCDKVNDLHKGDDSYKTLHSETLKQWELGKNPISIDRLQDICEVLGCDPGYLFGVYKEKTHSIANECEETGLSENSILSLKEILQEDDSLRDAIHEFLGDLLDNKITLGVLAIAYKKYKSKAYGDSYCVINTTTGKVGDMLEGDVGLLLLQNAFTRFVIEATTKTGISRNSMRKFFRGLSDENLNALIEQEKIDRERGK